MKHLLLLASAGLVLGACATASTDQAELTPLLVTSQATDPDMTCEDLSAEIQNMDMIMAQANADAANAENSGAVASTATSAAVNTALYSGALGRIPGLGVAANAAGGLAQQQAKAEAERQAENARRAELRKTTLKGIAVGKGC